MCSNSWLLLFCFLLKYIKFGQYEPLQADSYVFWQVPIVFKHFFFFFLLFGITSYPRVILYFICLVPGSAIP